MYGVATRALNQAVKRNLERFPEDFMFQLSEAEYSNLKSQFVTSSWGGRRKPPLAFTEQGVSMLSSVLRSEQAIAVNIQIMRVFVKMRRMISEYKELLEKRSWQGASALRQAQCSAPLSLTSRIWWFGSAHHDCASASAPLGRIACVSCRLTAYTCYDVYLETTSVDKTSAVGTPHLVSPGFSCCTPALRWCRGLHRDPSRTKNIKALPNTWRAGCIQNKII